jgi:hypothetical protein
LEKNEDPVGLELEFGAVLEKVQNL